MEGEIYAFECSDLPELDVLGFTGHERISMPYRFEIGLTRVLDGSLPPSKMKEAMGARATLKVHAPDSDTPYLYHGVIASLELVHAWHGRAVYQAVLVPKLWLLSLTRHCRVFVDETIPDIIDKVLQEGGLSGEDYSLQLSAGYKPRLHVCQYQESDLAFVMRWMEHEGIHFYFDHGDSQEKLVVSDAGATHDKLRVKPARYVPGTGRDDHMVVEALDTFRCCQQALPARSLVGDYDYNNPSVDLSADHDVADHGKGDVYVWGDNYETQNQGADYAKRRAERFLARDVVYRGHGRVFHLRSGYVFDLDEHPETSLNRGYLVTELRHSGNRALADPSIRRLLGVEHDDEYRVELCAVADDVVYRPPRDTPAPRIYGVVHARVDGPADSEFAQIDEQGRYHVRILFDERDQADGQASMWVRMLQPHAGSPEGFHFPLRKGTEVLLVFLGGDPDRPVIAGAVPNPQTPSPVVEDNHTQNVIRTGARNHIVMEDQGAYIDIYSPPAKTQIHLGTTHGKVHTHEITTFTEGSEKNYVGKYHDIIVDSYRTEKIGGDVTETYLQNHSLEVSLDQEIHVMENRRLNVDIDNSRTVGGNEDIGVKRNQSIEVRGHRDSTVCKNDTLHVDQNRTVEVKGDQRTKISGNFDLKVGANQMVKVTGTRSDTVSGSVTENYGSQTSIILGNSTHMIHGNQTVVTLGDHTHMITGKNNVIVNDDQSWFTVAKNFGVSAAFDISTFLGLKIEAHMALKLELSASIAIALALGASIELKHASLSQTGIEFGLWDMPKIHLLPLLLKI